MTMVVGFCAENLTTINARYKPKYVSRPILYTQTPKIGNKNVHRARRHLYRANNIFLAARDQQRKRS